MAAPFVPISPWRVSSEPRGPLHTQPSPRAEVAAAAWGPSSVQRPPSTSIASVDRWDFNLPPQMLFDPAERPYFPIDPAPPQFSLPSEARTPMHQPASPSRHAIAAAEGAHIHSMLLDRPGDSGPAVDLILGPRASLPLTDSVRPRPRPLDSAAGLAAELDALDLQEQAVLQRLVDRGTTLAVDLAAVDDRLVPKWAALGDTIAERAGRVREAQLEVLLQSPEVLDRAWRARFQAQEKQWQAKVAQLQSQVDVLRRRTRDPSPGRAAGFPMDRLRSPQRKSVGEWDSVTASPASSRAEGPSPSPRLTMDVADGAVGVVVTAVRGAAQAAGLRPGDAVKSIRASVATPTAAAFRQAAAALRPAAGRVTLVVDRDGEEHRLTVAI